MLILLCAALCAEPRGWAKTILQQRQAAVPADAAARFSIYPKPTSGQSLKATIKHAVSGVGALGLAVQADSVSSLLTGDRETIFEALQGVLGRAANVPGKPHVSMQCTVSTAAPGVDIVGRCDESAAEAWAESPSRVVCQFAVYSLEELGSCADAVLERAAESACFATEMPLCLMLDGEGEEVFDVLQDCYELACARSTSRHVVMTCTLTTNMSKWKSDEDKARDAAELQALGGPPACGEGRAQHSSRVHHE